MAGMCSGANLPNLQVIRQLARDQLVMHLESVTGEKDLVLDAELMPPLDRIAGAALLKEHGVGKIYKLESSKPLLGCEQRMFIVRPQSQLIHMIADQINAEHNAGTKRSYKILMVPRKLHVCEEVLEQEGVFGYVTIDEFQMDLVPIDKDVLSLELHTFYTSFFLDQDQSWLHTAARSLINVQQIYGRIPNVYGVGRAAQMVYDLMVTMQDKPSEGDKPNPCEIGHLILVDRDIDYVTPLCSQVTYEGLLDEIIGIKSGFVEFSPEISGRDQPLKMLLTAYDVLFDEIRSKHFSNVSAVLSSKAKQLQSGYDKRHNIKSVSDMKNFVSNDLRDLKQQHKSLALHVGACEMISKKKAHGDFVDQLRAEHSMLEGVDMKENKDFVEELVNKQHDRTQCLRLLCLLSLTQGGLSAAHYKSLVTQFLHSFGFEHLLTLNNLKRLGMLTEQGQSQAAWQLGKVVAMANVPRACPFRSLCKKLQLIPKAAEDIDLQNPNDVSYVFSGAYSPLLCKLIDQILVKEGVGLEETLKLAATEHFIKRQPKTQTDVPKPPRVVLIYFLGGCTYTELTALRFLGKMRGYQFVIATTSMLNSSTLLNLVTEKTS